MLPDKPAMREGDILLGLPSSGVHSNGFSLVRKVIERAGLAFTDKAPWNSRMTVGESLLTPTRIYVKPLMAAVEKDLLLGMAHITGGGLDDNIPRMLPKNLAAELDVSTWPVPEVLRWLKRAGKISNREFSRTWNTGIGMVIAVRQGLADEAMNVLSEAGETPLRIGKLVKREEEAVILDGVEAWD